MLACVILFIIGIICLLIIFKRKRFLPDQRKNKSDLFVSVIVPLRNEEKNVDNLLEKLLNQTYDNYEIICVDDNSQDKTYEKLSIYPVNLIKAPNKPMDWNGKSWALLHGTKEAKGDLLLFVDADVSLGSNTITNLVNEYLKEKMVISIMPYHKTKLFYEQFSFFFNYLQYAANGMGFNTDRYNLGLYGPIILISKETYKNIGTHKVVKSSIIEDLEFGIKLHEDGYKFKLFMGNDDISYRMYPDGFLKLFQGWCKNQASAFIRIKPLIIILVAIIIGMYIKIPGVLVKALVLGCFKDAIIYAFMYLVLIIALYGTSKHIGNYKWYVYLFYPIYLTFYIYVFVCSLLKKLFKIPVVWKGRKIDTNVK